MAGHLGRKIYAVFPGFEPSLNQGKSGLHLLFLFDPEIGLEKFLKAFDLVMGNVSSIWSENTLQISSIRADDAFSRLRGLQKQDIKDHQSGTESWDYIVLAPHIEQDKGLFGAQKGQVLALFQLGEVAGLELADEKLPFTTLKNRPWLEKAMNEHHQAFFHGSDAYSVVDIGRRHVWLKLASPRIEALRQAFVANESRIRIGYEPDVDGNLKEIESPPDVTVTERPWLKSVSVTGKASFFGGSNDNPKCRFDLSPDLTCLIGGSMTGKSTLLDGLRVYVNAPVPTNDGLKTQVEKRGRDGFLGGSPDIELECPGTDSTAPDYDRWPAEFFTQNELQRLAQEPEAIERILSRLVITETQEIEARENQLSVLDQELNGTVDYLAKLDGDLAEAEQAWERSQTATEEIKAFSDAGIDELHRVSRSLQGWLEYRKSIQDIGKDLNQTLQSTQISDIPVFDDYLANVIQFENTDTLRIAGVDLNETEFSDRWERIRSHIRSARDELNSVERFSKFVVERLREHELAVRINVDQNLAELGYDGTRIKEFQALSRQSSLLESYKANLDEVHAKLNNAEHSFEGQLADRRNLVAQQRVAFDRILSTVQIEFGGKITARRIDHGDRAPLEFFVLKLSQRGITRWWNELSKDQRPAPETLLNALKNDELSKLRMSKAVQSTFRDSMIRSRQRELAAISCRDRYILELKLDDGSFRRLDELSGGQRVSVLLSLLLQTNDGRPLVIDQPEDELDNRFLSETVLPALKKLKGRRQIIVATHNADIVVNGDADQVIQLEATANQGRVAEAGAIEKPSIRDAIVRTVDGGDDAFRLRQKKYGF